MYTDGLGEISLLEEEYFYKKDRELIEKMKENEKKKQDLLERTSHYHKCASCGHGMAEKVHEDFSFLQCQHCESIQFTMQSLDIVSQGKKLKNLIKELEIKKQNLAESA